MTDSLRRIWEQSLVVRAQAGDDRAFGELVGVFHKPLRTYVGRMLAASEVADDVLQETWLDVYRHLPRLRNIAAIRSWLFRIARMKTALHLRRNRVYLDMEPLAVDPIEHRADQASEFSAEDLRCLNQCLDRLSLLHREVLVLRYLQELSYEEISEVVGCGLGTVRSRLYYAKQSLREEMEKSRP